MRKDRIPETMLKWKSAKRKQSVKCRKKWINCVQKDMNKYGFQLKDTGYTDTKERMKAK